MNITLTHLAKMTCVAIALFALFTLINYANKYGIGAALQSLDMLLITLFLSAVALLSEGIALLLITCFAALSCLVV